MSAGSSDPLRLVHDQRLRLRQVVARLGAPSPSRSIRALCLVFDTVTCMLAAEGDDSLSITSEPAPASGPSSVSVADEEPWSLALGKPLLWSWSMTNQQGYRDACQLEFAEDVSDQSVVIQLVVVASAIKVRLMDEEFVPPPSRKT